LIIFRLFEKHPGHAHGDLEPGIGPEKFRKEVGGGEITLLRYLDEDIPVLFLPEKLVPIWVEAKGLVKLKIHGEQRHDSIDPSLLKKKLKAHKLLTLYSLFPAEAI